MFIYNEDQLFQIRALVTDGNFPAAYRLAASFANGGEGVSQASILWMQGAANINQNVGTDAAFVRQYTAAQYQSRFGTALDLTLLQNVSNTIAATVLGQILESGTVPSIDTIALDDALPAATDIFRGDPGGWAGRRLHRATVRSSRSMQITASSCRAWLWPVCTSKIFSLHE